MKPIIEEFLNGNTNLIQATSLVIKNVTELSFQPENESIEQELEERSRELEILKQFQEEQIQQQNIIQNANELIIRLLKDIENNNITIDDVTNVIQAKYYEAKILDLIIYLTCSKEISREVSRYQLTSPQQRILYQNVKEHLQEELGIIDFSESQAMLKDIKQTAINRNPQNNPENPNIDEKIKASAPIR